MREQQLYLLGHPVGHSKSAVMYNAVYRTAGLPWRYELLDCATEDDARAVLAKRSFLQVNITTPYKPLAYAAADERMPAVEVIGGANVLVNREGSLIAHNTDGAGCTGFLLRCGFPLAGARVAVCGTGPTAVSLLCALVEHGAASVALLSRSGAHARDVLDEWRLRAEERGLLAPAHAFADAAADATVEGSSAREADRARSAQPSGAAPVLQALSYDEARDALSASDLVINATPLGMGAHDPAPFDTALLHAGQWAFDCVYGHGATAFVAGARAAGCRTFDGAGMLVGQAVETVRILQRSMGGEAQRRLEQIDNARMFATMADAAGFSLDG